MTMPSNKARLAAFITAMTHIVDLRAADEERILAEGREALAALIAVDDWLPDFCAEPHPQFYSQYLLYCDPRERFSLVSFVWGPGQATPIHDHTVWGLVGMLRGAEISERYELGRPMRRTAVERLEPGMVDAVSPKIGDVHKVMNASPGQVSISIHVYGANIGAVERHVYDAETGAGKAFVSGYSSDRLPNPWRGAVRAA